MDARIGRSAVAAGWCSIVALLLALAGWTPTAVAQQGAGDGLAVVALRPNFFLIGGAGGNIARLDGGITWRPMKQMKVHVGSSALKEGGALAVW